MFISGLLQHGCQKYPVNQNENNPIEPEMIYINNDLSFTNGQRWDSTIYEIVDSLPIVTLNPYYIGKYELTNSEYFQFVKDGGYSDSAFWSVEGWKTINDSNWTKPKYWGNSQEPWESDPFSSKCNTPVHGISFYEAEAYCAWLSAKTGKNYHIPSSLQWVRAAKGPYPGTKYTWGNEFDEANAYYPYFTNTHLMPVTSYPNGKSHDECYHMIGNAYEICIFIPFSDEYENFPCIFSSGLFSAASSTDDWIKAMTTTSAEGIEKDTRRYAVGVRICID